jgi:arsenite methyltransferase
MRAVAPRPRRDSLSVHMSQLAFDEETGKRLEALYQISDVVRRREIARTALGAAPGERVLDVGCGPGFFCAELLAEVGDSGWVTGVDASPHMLDLARRRCAQHANVAFAQADATSLPLEDASVDAALCVQVLEYVADYGSALAELARVVRAGGRVVIWDTDWATTSWHSRDPARMQRCLAAWDEHLTHRSLPRCLGAAMRSAGFDHVNATAHPFATTTAEPDTFGVSLIGMIANFATGRQGLTDADVNEWAAEQRELGERGEFFFTHTQFCFTGTRTA